MSQHDEERTIGLDDEGIPLIAGLSPSRRAFLKLAGFSFGVAMLPGCSRGAEHDIVPFHDKPEEVKPDLYLIAVGVSRRVKERDRAVAGK